jgi:hypothetical protein
MLAYPVNFVGATSEGFVSENFDTQAPDAEKYKTVVEVAPGPP